VKWCERTMSGFLLFDHKGFYMSSRLYRVKCHGYHERHTLFMLLAKELSMRRSSAPHHIHRFSDAGCNDVLLVIYPICTRAPHTRGSATGTSSVTGVCSANRNWSSGSGGPRAL
jgi:hypothetical protein